MIPNSIVKKFLSGVETCRSVDCVLVKLSSAVYEIEDFVHGFPVRGNTSDLVHHFLYRYSVQRVLASLGVYREYVLEKIYGDVRFKNLRKYANIIMKAIDDASRNYVGTLHISNYERPALWQIEYQETHNISTYDNIGYKIKGNYSRGIRKETNKNTTKSTSRVGWLNFVGGVLALLFGVSGIFYCLIKMITLFLEFLANETIYYFLIGVGYFIAMYLSYLLASWGWRKISSRD